MIPIFTKIDSKIYSKTDSRIHSKNHFKTHAAVVLIPAILSACNISSSSDAPPPIPEITRPSSNPYYSSPGTLSIEGTCESGDTVNLIPDDATNSSGTFATECLNSVFAFSVSRESDGTNQLKIFQTKKRRNSPSNTLTWVRETHNTVALYHLDASDPTLDSSNLPASLKNTLTNFGTISASGQFAEGQSFSTSSSQMMSVDDNSSHATLSTKMSLEAYVQLSSLPSDGVNYVLISKNGGTSGTYGWEFGIAGNFGQTYLYFAESPDGTTAPTVVLAPAFIAADTNSFHHMAMTWNSGSLKFFYDGTIQDPGVSLPSSINSPTSVPLSLGSSGGGSGGNNTGASQFFDGILDEVRISNVVRWTASFSVPSIPYSAD